jgi:hypothetical protein
MVEDVAKRKNKKTPKIKPDLQTSRKNKLASSQTQLEKTLNQKSNQIHSDRWDGKFLELPILIKKQNYIRQISIAIVF